jgi:hypothetical protein
MTTTLACAKCGGSGGGPDPAQRCPACGGSGHLTIWASPPAQERAAEAGGDPQGDLTALRVENERLMDLLSEGHRRVLEIVPHADALDAELRRLRVENERQAALIDQLADALRNLLHDTGHGVFAHGPDAGRIAEAALAKVPR